MRTDRELTVDRLKQVLNYDQNSGAFTWLVKQGSKAVGSIAGSFDAMGYVVVTVDGKAYKAHRLAWMYVYEGWPSDYIDHINGNKSDNRIENLRDVPHSINIHNLNKPYRSNKSGFLGVSKNGSGWRAEIRIDKKKRNLGTFNTPEEASEAYKKAKEEFMRRAA